MGRSYEPEDEYDADDSGADYNSGLGRTYDEPSKSSIPGDYVVDYQPLENVGTDYSDDYDDSKYDDYDTEEENNTDSSSDYDEDKNRPESRKPINFERYE